MELRRPWRTTRVVTFLALLGFSLACGGLGGGDGEEGGGGGGGGSMGENPDLELDGMYMDADLEDQAASSAEDDRLINLYAQSRYAYCDARLLSQLWGQDVWNAKVYIGQKIDSGLENLLAELLNEARAHARQDPESRACDFYETRYSYSDAEALATIWSISIEEAKTRVEQKVLWGDEALIDSFLKNPSAPPTEPAPAPVVSPSPTKSKPSSGTSPSTGTGPSKGGKTGKTGKTGKGGKGGKGKQPADP